MQFKQLIGAGDTKQLPCFDGDEARPDRIVCACSPEVPLGPIPFLEKLQATGMATHELTKCYRSDPKLLAILQRLRIGLFTEAEHAELVAAGDKLDCTIGEEFETTKYGTRKTYQCVVRAARATVLLYNLIDVKNFCDRMQLGKEIQQVKCYDVLDAHFDPRSEVRCHQADLEDFLEGAPENVNFTAGCPVRLGRSAKGEALSTTGGGVLARKTGDLSQRGQCST